MLRCDEIVMEICGKCKKGENFLEILCKLYVKFEIFSSKTTKFLRKFLEKFVQISGKFSEIMLQKLKKNI